MGIGSMQTSIGDRYETIVVADLVNNAIYVERRCEYSSAVKED